MKEFEAHLNKLMKSDRAPEEKYKELLSMSDQLDLFMSDLEDEFPELAKIYEDGDLEDDFEDDFDDLDDLDEDFDDDVDDDDYDFEDLDDYL